MIQEDIMKDIRDMLLLAGVEDEELAKKIYDWGAKVYEGGKEDGMDLGLFYGYQDGYAHGGSGW